MPNPTHYPSLELCKRLKELGWSKETEKEWYLGRHFGMLAGEGPEVFLGEVEEERGNTIEVLCPAPSVAELGEVLPNHYHSWKGLSESPEEWACGHFSEPEFEASEPMTADTEADARAKLLIHLAERGEIKM